MKIIGLAGKAGAGKDTVAQLALEWCKEKGIAAERFAFADPLKVSAAACFGIPPHQALTFCNWLKQPGIYVSAERRGEEGQDVPVSVVGMHGIKGKKVSGRQFLQHYGTEAHRDVFDHEFWVHVTESKLNAAAGNLDVAFLTDPRFKNESDMIRRHDGEVWEVVRPGLPDVESHSSEAGLPEGAIEFQINNDGSLDDLRALVRLVCESNLEEAA